MLTRSSIKIGVRPRASPDTSSRPLGHLGSRAAVDRQLDVWQREAIARARQQGASWSEIGEVLGVTKQAAWQLYDDDIREMPSDVRQRSGLSDDEAQQLADAERSPHR